MPLGNARTEIMNYFRFLLTTPGGTSKISRQPFPPTPQIEELSFFCFTLDNQATMKIQLIKRSSHKLAALPGAQRTLDRQSPIHDQKQR